MAPRSKRSIDVLSALSASEGRDLLHALLQAHPELTEEARSLARRGHQAVDRREVAARVVEAFDALTVEEFWSRSGRHAHGYVEPADAAWELLEETIEGHDHRFGHHRDYAG